jgi:hypothetical protein
MTPFSLKHTSREKIDISVSPLTLVLDVVVSQMLWLSSSQCVGII